MKNEEYSSVRNEDEVLQEAMESNEEKLLAEIGGEDAYLGWCDNQYNQS